jgi:hypothetical protein
MASAASLRAFEEHGGGWVGHGNEDASLLNKDTFFFFDDV